MRLASLFTVVLFLPRLGAAQEPAPASVTLEEALRRAELVQPTIIQARGASADASAQYRTAWGSFLPDINANSSYGSSFSEGTRTDPVTGELRGANTQSKSVSMNLSANLDLFTGFRRGADLRAARAQEDAADAGLVDARFQVALTTKQQFFAALAAAELVRVRDASVRRAQEQLNVSVNKLRSGTATRSDSLRSLVTLGSAQLDLLNARTTLATSEAALGRQIGVASRVAAVRDTSILQVSVAPDTAALRVEAEAASPVVRSADAQVKAADANLSAAKSVYWPALNLTGRYGYSGSDAQDYNLFNSRSLSLGLSWPLFNGFAREQGVVNRSTALDNARADAADARRQVSAELTQRFAQLDAARAQIDIATTSVSAAEEDLRVNQERYRLGAATIVDVLSSQEALSQAEVDVVQAWFDYLVAKAQIEALIGRSL